MRGICMWVQQTASFDALQTLGSVFFFLIVAPDHPCAPPAACPCPRPRLAHPTCPPPLCQPQHCFMRCAECKRPKADDAKADRSRALDNNSDRNLRYERDDVNDGEIQEEALDLCTECFAAGQEPFKHLKTHAYRVMDKLSESFFTGETRCRTA